MEEAPAGGKLRSIRGCFEELAPLPSPPMERGNPSMAESIKSTHSTNERRIAASQVKPDVPKQMRHIHTLEVPGLLMLSQVLERRRRHEAMELSKRIQHQDRLVGPVFALQPGKFPLPLWGIERVFSLLFS